MGEPAKTTSEDKRADLLEKIAELEDAIACAEHDEAQDGDTSYDIDDARCRLVDLRAELADRNSQCVTDKTDAQLASEWNECHRVTGTANDADEICQAVQRQSEIEREQTERTIKRMKGAK